MLQRELCDSRLNESVWRAEWCKWTTDAHWCSCSAMVRRQAAGVGCYCTGLTCRCQQGKHEQQPVMQ